MRRCPGSASLRCATPGPNASRKKTRKKPPLIFNKYSQCVWGFANSYVVKYVEPTNGTREKYPVSEGGLNSGENSVEGVEGEKK